MTALRDGVETDLDALVAIDEAAFGSRAWSRGAISDELQGAGDSRVVVVASAASGVCGFAIALVTGEVADLQRIAVSEGLRGHGVGSSLLSEVVDRCRRSGCSQLLLEVAADDLAAVGFYRRRGFDEIARRSRYYADGSDALVMRREF